MKSNGENKVFYLSVFEWPKDGKLIVPGVTGKIVSAKTLATGKSLKTKTDDAGAVITLPAKMPDPIASVIRVEIEGRFSR